MTDTQRATATELALALVINYLDIATPSAYPGEVHFTATPADHPVVVSLRAGGGVVALIHPSITGPPVLKGVTHQGAFAATLTSFMAPEVEVHDVYPHPALRAAGMFVGRKPTLV